jgi:hypothetical protein
VAFLDLVLLEQLRRASAKLQPTQIVSGFCEPFEGFLVSERLRLVHHGFESAHCACV